MAVDRDRIERDLKRILKGDVRFDNASCRIYSRAACIYSILPLGVVLPADKYDIAALVKYASEREISLTARGAGSGLAGQTVNKGIIVDCSKHMTSVSLAEDRKTVTVQPGVVQSKLNSILKRKNLFFPPDPSSSDYCTLGGMTANNSSGPRSVKYGVTSDYIESLSYIDFKGKYISVGKSAGTSMMELERILAKYRNHLRAFPDVKKNSSGYNLKALSDNPDNMAPFFCGSEGTLGIFTEMTFRVVALPETKKTALIYFDSIEKAFEAVLILRFLNPSALEIIDETFISLLKKEKSIPYEIPENAKAAVVLEIDGYKHEVPDTFAAAVNSIISIAVKSICADGDEENHLLWKFRKQASPIINRLPGKKKSARFIEDPVIPPDRFLEFVAKIKNLFRKHDVFAVIFGHAGDGNIHINPLLDLSDPSDVSLMKTLADETHDIIKDTGGAMSGEHGDGRLRSSYLPWFYKNIYPAFEEIKKIFDPEDIFNPGIIAGKNIPQKINENLRYFFQNINPDFSAGSSEILKCHGCGACRDFCPIFTATLEESLSTRGRIHLLQSGEGSNETEILAKCSQCRRCSNMCPMFVEAFKLTRISASKQDMTLRDIILSNPSFASKLAEFIPRTIMSLINSQTIKYLNGKITGISDRVLALIPEGGTLKASDHNSQDNKEVLYFPGCYAKLISPEEYGNPLIQVLEILGYKVILPDFSCCGIPALANGNKELFEKSAKKNLEVLSLYLKKGDIPVLTGCPSCFVSLKKDYPEYFPGEQSESLSSVVRDFTDFIFEILKEKKFDKKRPLKIAFHFPCHSAENDKSYTHLAVLKLLPGLEIIELPKECCGMAGTYGLKSENREISQKIGEPLFRIIKNERPDFIVTPCGMCRIQFQTHTGVKAIHPLKLIADNLK